MFAVGLTEFGGPEILHVVELPDPEPAAGEVRIRVHAVGVNPTDSTFRTGGLAARLADRTPPYIPGIDVAGVIEELGENTQSRLSIGDPVIAYVIPFGVHGGTYAERIVADQRSVVRAPADVTFAEASTLLLNSVTAHLALAALGAQSGEVIAITGAAGAVGGYATQLAKSQGLIVIAVAAAADEPLVRSLGADDVVARGPRMSERIRAIKPDGVRGLIDAAALNAEALAPITAGGALSTLKGWKGPGERGITVNAVSSYGSAADTGLLEALSKQAEEGRLRLRVAEVLPARQAAEAHRRLAAGGDRGRLVLDFSEPISRA